MNKSEINAFMANTRELTVSTVAEAQALTFPNDGGDFWVRIEERGGAKFKTSATGSGDGFSSLLRDDGGYLELDVEGAVTPEMFGAVVYETKSNASSGVNSRDAVMAAVAYTKGKMPLHWPQGGFINVGSGISTQSDAAYGTTFWVGNDCTLVRVGEGTTLTILGGAAYQEIFDLEVTSDDVVSGAQATYDSTPTVQSITPDAEKNGVLIDGSRVNVRLVAYDNQGFNYHLRSNDGNSNACSYELTGFNSGACGLYVNGTFNNLSVSTLRYRGRSGQGPLFWAEPQAPLRQFVSHIYVENGLLDQTIPDRFPTQVFLGGSNLSRFWIYSECQNQSTEGAEILAGPDTDVCEIISARRNKDADTGSPSTNRWLRSNGDISRPFPERSGPIYSFASRAARIGRAGENAWVNLDGNDGRFGCIYGGIHGIGFSHREDNDSNVLFEASYDQEGKFEVYSGASTTDVLLASKGTVDSPTAFSAAETPYTKAYGLFTGADYYTTISYEVRTVTVGGGNKASSDLVWRTTRGSASVLSDTFGIRSDGDIQVFGDGAGILMKSPSGTSYRVSVDDAGNLVVT